MKAPEKRLISEAGKRALEVMHACATPSGFCASAPGVGFHYPEIWARDNGIMTLGALASGEPDLIEASRHYLECMTAHQSPLGMIPINVDTAEQRVNKENGRQLMVISGISWRTMRYTNRSCTNVVRTSMRMKNQALV